MKVNFNRREIATLISTSLVPGFNAFGAEAFPSRPIRIVVPGGPGGLIDSMARLIGQKLSESMGQPVIVDNKAGAGGIIGSEFVARAVPDGYTLLMVFPSHAINPSLYKKLPYDTKKDFAPVIAVTLVNLVLVVNSNFPARNVSELLDICRKSPNSVNYAVAEGSLGHLASSVFCSMANIQAIQVPYKTVPQMTSALLAGEVQFFFDTSITAIPQIKAGKFRALGRSGLSRSPSLPQVQPISESGVPGFNIVGRNGLLAPAGTPPLVIAKLNTAIQHIFDSQDYREQLARYDLEPLGGTPEQFESDLQADMNRWARVFVEQKIPKQ